MMPWAGFWIDLAGMAAISMAMDRHHAQVWGDAVLARARVWRLRCAGWALLAFAAGLAIHWQGASMGLTLWSMEVSLAAIAIGFLLSYAPRAVPWLAAASLALAGMAAVAA